MDAWLSAPIDWLDWTGVHVTGWKLIGYTGALMFGGRWLVQFLASRRAGRPVIPRLFWYMSVIGSLMTLSYFTFSPKQDSVGVLQNAHPADAPGRITVAAAHGPLHRRRAGADENAGRRDFHAGRLLQERSRDASAAFHKHGIHRIIELEQIR